jgi:hypothetical protein
VSGDTQLVDKCETTSEWSTVGRLLDDVGSAAQDNPAPHTPIVLRAREPMAVRRKPAPLPQTAAVTAAVSAGVVTTREGV